MELARRLVSLARRYHPKIDFALLGGHGDKGSINLGDWDWDKGTSWGEAHLSISDLDGKGVQRSISRFFKPNPTIILASCSTGKSGGIADNMSRLGGATVIAPDRPTAIGKIEVSKQDGNLAFKVEYKEESAGQTYSAVRG